MPRRSPPPPPRRRGAQGELTALKAELRREALLAEFEAHSAESLEKLAAQHAVARGEVRDELAALEAAAAQAAARIAEL